MKTYKSNQTVDIEHVIMTARCSYKKCLTESVSQSSRMVNKMKKLQCNKSQLNSKNSNTIATVKKQQKQQKPQRNSKINNTTEKLQLNGISNNKKLKCNS